MLTDCPRLSGSACTSSSMRLGKWPLCSSWTTWRLVTRYRRPSRAKKKPLALVSGRSLSNVATRAAARSRVSIGVTCVASSQPFGELLAHVGPGGREAQAAAVPLEPVQRHVVVDVALGNLAGAAPLEQVHGAEQRVAQGRAAKKACRCRGGRHGRLRGRCP